MTQVQTFKKDPDAKLDYGFDWSNWLASGETISVSVWTVPSGITEESNEKDGTSTKIWLSGGLEETTYTISNRITTSADRIDERTFCINVIER